MSSKKAVAAVLAEAARQLQQTLHSMGDYDHVTVRAERGHLVLYIDDDDEPIARLSPLGGGTYGLGFRSHTGRWEPMPFTGNINEGARSIVEMLGPYLEKGVA